MFKFYLLKLLLKICNKLNENKMHAMFTCVCFMTCVKKNFFIYFI